MAVNSQVRSKLVGVGALGFAVLIVTNNIVENAVTGRPEPGVTDDEVLAWALDAEPFLWSSTISFPLSMVFLIALVIGLASRLRSAGQDATMAIVGGLGAAMMFGGLSTAFAADAGGGGRAVARLDGVDRRTPGHVATTVGRAVRLGDLGALPGRHRRSGSEGRHIGRDRISERRSGDAHSA